MCLLQPIPHHDIYDQEIVPKQLIQFLVSSTKRYFQVVHRGDHWLDKFSENERRNKIKYLKNKSTNEKMSNSLLKQKSTTYFLIDHNLPGTCCNISSGKVSRNTVGVITEGIHRDLLHLAEISVCFQGLNIVRNEIGAFYTFPKWFWIVTLILCGLKVIRASILNVVQSSWCSRYLCFLPLKKIFLHTPQM